MRNHETIKCPQTKLEINGGSLEIRGGFRLTCIGWPCQAYPCDAVKEHEKKVIAAMHPKARSG